jgi:KAP family P-loop domain
LDRCEARKALEVFESTKVFLDIEGFIFIIGLSYDTLSKLLDLQYQPIGVKGEEYIRKIIQVYVNLPKWKNPNIKELINIFSAKIGEEYKDLFKDKEKLIATAAGLNPREVKRLINRFMVTHSVEPKMNPEEYLVRYALEARWSEIYKEMDQNESFRELVNEYAGLEKHERENRIINRKRKGAPLESSEEKLFNIQPAFWEFLTEYRDTLPQVITDWQTHKESYETSSDPTPKASEAKESEVDQIISTYKRVLAKAAEKSSREEEFMNRVDSIRKQFQEEASKGILPARAVAELERFILELRQR